MMRHRTWIFAVLAALAAHGAAAQSGCYYDGQLYPEGTRIGGLICVNGQWIDG
jgi:hypothetical protein